MFVGTFVLSALDSITAMTLVLNGLAAPWVVVILVGLFARRKRYDPKTCRSSISGGAAGAIGSSEGGTPVPS